MLTPEPEELPHLPPEACRGANWLPPVSKLSDKVRLRKQASYYSVGVNKEKQDLYLSLLRNYKEQYDVKDPRTSQFIAFKRIECGFVNEICVPVYNDHTILDFDKNVVQILIGDKIMVSKNNDVPVYLPPEPDTSGVDSSMLHQSNPANVSDDKDNYYDTKQIRLMNGSVYMIESIGQAKAKEEKKDEIVDNANETQTEQSSTIKSVKFFVLDDLAAEFVRPNCKAFAKCSKPCHAYALTIHKFQGSEADTIVYGVSNSKMETWKHVYTAITRGKKRVVIVGTWENLVAAVKRKSRPRQTALQEKMCKVMAKIKKGEMPSIEEEDANVETPNESCETEDKPTETKEERFTKLSQRIEQAICAKTNLSENSSPIVHGKGHVQAGTSSFHRKRGNGAINKDQCNTANKCRAHKDIRKASDPFPDDSFNDIVTQMPESELKELTGESMASETPIVNRNKNGVQKQGIVYSTPKCCFDEHNDSSFDIQMSQMNESQYKHFMDDFKC